MCINHLRSYWLKAMFKGYCKKKFILILSLVILICFVILVCTELNKLVKTTYPTPEEGQVSDEKPPKSQPPPNSQHEKVNYQYLIKLAYNNKEKFINIVNQLSSSELEDVLLKQMKISNLTSKRAQIGFIDCAGVFLLQKLKGKQTNSPIPIPPSHQHCKNMSFKKSGPLVRLVSFPSSGNSWVRQLLEAATGIYTGAAFAYCDLHYVKEGMIGENVDTNNVLVVKVHGSPDDVVKNAQKVIYLVRNPFGVILAEKNRNISMTSKNHTERNSHTEEFDIKKYVNDSDWESWVKNESDKWKNQVEKWLHYRKVPVLISGYDNLMKDTYSELKKMLDFIEYPYTDDDIECAVNSPAEAFHRNHTKKYPNLYPPDLQNYILNRIKEIDADLLKHNISIYFTYKEA